MSENGSRALARAGDIAMLVGVKHKNHLFRLEPGRVFQTHRGEISHDDLIGTPWGTIVRSHIGRTFHLLEPSIADLINELPRRTQILYPKDIGFILMTMGVGPGDQIGEAGSGSGAMTLALTHAVGDSGHVFSYDSHPDSLGLARKNIARFGSPDRVTFKERALEEGLDETDLDGFFLDVPYPELAIPIVRETLKPGGAFGCIVPTTNQISGLLQSLEDNRFAFIDICEILLRYYRTNPHRLRPTDRMVAHTGFLVFARPVILPDERKEKEENEDDVE